MVCKDEKVLGEAEAVDVGRADVGEDGQADNDLRLVMGAHVLLVRVLARLERFSIVSTVFLATICLVSKAFLSVSLPSETR